MTSNQLRYITGFSWLIVRSWLICGGLLLIAHASQAQVTTNITSDGSLGSTVNQVGDIYNIEGGNRPGNGPNLFHSFDSFSVGAGDTAKFNNTTPQFATTNILSRVTGGNPSNIFGTIDSLSYPGANLFLLNPAGVLFGPTASLNVSGSFHVSTADFLRFEDGAIFVADLSQDSTLTVAPPVAFGFLRQNPAPISVEQSALQVPDGKSLSMIGGDIELAGGSITASGGKVNLASVASTGEVTLGEASGVQVEAAQRGNVTLTQGTLITTTGEGGGSVKIVGGKFVANNSDVYASINGPAVGPFAGELGTGIDVEMTDSILIDNGSEIGTNVFFNVAPELGSGGIRLNANHVEVALFSEVQSVLFGGSTGGPSGDVEVNGNTILVRNAATLSTRTGGTAKSGNVVLNGTESVELRDGAFVFTLGFAGTGFAGTGRGGDIEVNTQALRLFGSNFPEFATGFSPQASAGTQGGTGNLTVNAHSLDMVGGIMFTSNQGTGPTGNFDINLTGDANISGYGPDFFKGIFTNTQGPAPGGHLNLNAANLSLTNHASLQGATFSSGAAGGVTVEVAGTLDVREASFIASNSIFGTGNSADVNVTAKDIVITGVSDSTNPIGSDFTALTSTTNTGVAGNINVSAESLQIKDKAQVQSSSFGPANAGNITIQLTGPLLVENGGVIGAFATGAGNGGKITVTADRVIVTGVNSVPIVDPVTGGDNLAVSSISSQTQAGGGDAGNIQIITTKGLQVLDGAQIDSVTFGAGDGGVIEIFAGNVLISGEDVLKGEFFDNPNVGRSRISAGTQAILLEAAATGNGGTVRIQAPHVQIVNKGEVNSSTTTPGSGGNIEIVADRVTVSGDGRIRAVSTERPFAGDAGNILVTASEVFQSDNGIVSSAASEVGRQSKGGLVTITAGQFQLSNDAFVSARNLGDGDGGSLTISVAGTFRNDGSTVTTSAEQGRGGNVTIAAGQNIQLTNGASVTAESSGPGDAGDILLTAGDAIRLDNSSKVTTNATQADGGNIKLIAPTIIDLIDSRITSSVGGGETTVGGNINIDPQFVILQGSQILANAFLGQGGNITIVGNVVLVDPFSNIDASSQLGIDGEVDIQAPTQALSGTLAPLPEAAVEATELLREVCAARVQGGQVSSLVVGARDGLPLEPGNPLPSPLYQDGQAASLPTSQ